MDTLADPGQGVRGWGTQAALVRNGNAVTRGPASVRALRGRVLVLNASYEPINVCTVRRATVLLLKSRAEVLEQAERALHSERLTLQRPLVIRLVNYVRIPHDIHRRKITRKAVLARDAWTCQYCGSQRSGLTVDHVIPRSRCGKSVWENIVASCAPCNRRKGNRLPREIEMHPRTTPRAPGPTVFIRVAAPKVPASWEPYLGLAAA
jgi:5-methylcytosine-specific restriction endonuclease McrA